MQLHSAAVSRRVSTLPLRPNYDKLGVALYVLDSCSKNMYDVTVFILLLNDYPFYVT